MRVTLLHILSYLFLCFLPIDLFAMDFSIHPNNESETLAAILATGEIKRGDTLKLLADIHRMTGLLGSSFARIGNFGKIEPWQMASPVRQAVDVSPLLTGKVNFAFIRA